MNGPFSDSKKRHPAFEKDGTGARVGIEDGSSASPPPLPRRDRSDPVKFSPPKSSAHNSSLSMALDSDAGTFEASADGLDAATARRLEETFMSGYQRNLKHLRAIGSEIDGSVYDFHPEREHRRDWDERNEAKRAVMRGVDHRLPRFPQSPTEQYTVIRKPLFGSASPKVSISASVWSPMDALSMGSVAYGDEIADIQVVDSILRQLLVHERNEVFFYVAICSTSGWEEDLFQMPPDGLNYGVALIEPRFPGWAVSAPEHWTPALQACFQPDSIEDMRKRIARAVMTNEELSSEGGIVLLSEVSERTGVPEQLVLEEVEVLCKTQSNIVLEFVEGSHILRRKRNA